MIRLITAALAAAVVATPALAAKGPFFSLGNTDFVVLIAFLVFVGILVYYKVPATLMSLLDKRADGIRADLDEAKALRDAALAELDALEKKHAEIAGQADRIVAQAKADAEEAATQAKADLEVSIQRRLQAADERIASAEAGAVRAVRERAVEIATAAAAQVLAQQTDPARSGALVDDAIETVRAKLH